MRALVQLVDQASVSVDGKVIGSCDRGFLVYAAIHADDEESDAASLADRIAKLRICPDGEGKLSASLADYCSPHEAQVLLISNFTLYGDAWSGRRPGYGASAGREKGSRLFEALAALLRGLGVDIAVGEFGADMRVNSIAAGPVNLLVDTRK